MDSNIAEKIKGSAYWILCICIGSSVIGGISLIASESSIGFLVIIIGTFISWLSSITLYGFGKLIENSEIIAKNISGIKSYNEDFKLNKDTSSEERTENT